jgi:hypothetical protein
MVLRKLAWIAALAAVGCGSSTPEAQRLPPAPAELEPAPSSTGEHAAAPAPDALDTTREGPAASAPGEPAQPGQPCGALDCRRFETPREAFRYLLASEPLVLGIGEAHALAGAPEVSSSARRFSDELLAELEGRASHLIVELLAPNPSCQQATREVEQIQKPVTSQQSAQNQNDYVALGHRARGLGIEPFVLSPTCDELSAISQAGASAIDRTLTTIADVTRRMVLAALVKNARAHRERMVLAYGGALHNDESPEAARAGWSYGPELSRATGGRYVALDLIVREFIKDSDVWRALPWYEHFDPASDPQSAIVMRTGPRSYVLFFPKSGADAGDAR